MPKFIKRLQISGLHGWLDYDVEFSDGINIFYGRNGSGKTTMLHVISNLLGGDIARFVALRFETISVEMSNGDTLTVRQTNAKDRAGRQVEWLKNGERLDSFDPLQARRPLPRDDRESYSDRVRRLRMEIGLRPTYFPAFRSILDVTAQFEKPGAEEELYYLLHRSERLHRASPYGEMVSPQMRIVRRLFGEFAPRITFPSLSDVEARIIAEVGEANSKVTMANRRVFSRTFLNSLDAVTQGGGQPEVQPEELLSEIEKLLGDVYDPIGESRATLDALTERVHEMKSSYSSGRTSEKTVSDILAVYRNALVERLAAQSEAFDALDQLLNSVNSFLEQKKLDIVRLPEEALRASETRQSEGRFIVELKNGTRASPSTLSSGERQLVCLIYSATRLGADDTIVLVDEPELSLNIDWQRRLLTEMQRQMGAQQIIVCTHSPDIGGDHEDAVRILQPVLRSHTTKLEHADDGEPAGTDEDFDDPDEVPF